MPAGRSLIEELWEELDRVVDSLMVHDLHGSDWSKVDHARVQGRAEGIAYSIAVLTQSPRTPDINVVREEAMERWEERQSGPSD